MNAVSRVVAGVNAARDAILTFMVGGSADGYSKAEPVLKQMGKNVVHTGHCGTGQVSVRVLYTKHQCQCCDDGSNTALIEINGVTHSRMGLQPHFEATPLFSMSKFGVTGP